MGVSWHSYQDYKLGNRAGEVSHHDIPLTSHDTPLSLLCHVNIFNTYDTPMTLPFVVFAWLWLIAGADLL